MTRSLELPRIGTLGILLSLSLTGCQGLLTSGTTGAGPSTSVVDPQNSAILRGRATGPQGLVSNNSASIISNNSAGLVSNNSASVISNNAGNLASGYHVAAWAEDPIANALVYLTDPSDHFFARQDGTILTTTTDGAGNYLFPAKLPVNRDTFVNVILSGNRREVGYLLPAAGENKLNISVASTFVTEFLRQHANQDGRTMSGYNGGLASLPALTRLTQQGLNTGLIPFDGSPNGTLNIGNIGSLLDMTYSLVVGKNVGGLGDAWANLLGYRINAATTVLGTGNGNAGGSGVATAVDIWTPIGITEDASGDIFVSEYKNDAIREVFPDGTTRLIAGNASSPPGFSGDGGDATKALMDRPRALALGPDGNLYVADSYNHAIRVVALSRTPSPWVSQGWGVGNLYTVAGGSTSDSVDGPAASVRLVDTMGLVFDKAGNLFFSESKNKDGAQASNHVRVLTPPNSGTQSLYGVSCPAGNVTTLVGPANTFGSAGDGGPGVSAQLYRPDQLVIDRDGNLLVADGSNNRIRCLAAASGTYYGQAMTGGNLYTVAGNGMAGSAGDGGAALQAQLNNPSGLAVDPLGRLYIVSKNDYRVRVVGTDGVIKTLAGGGVSTSDGDARQIFLSEPLNCALEPNGNLLVTETRGNRARRLYLQWGF